MKALRLLQLSPELYWYVIGVYTTKEDMVWAIEFAHTYPDQFKVEVKQ
jgi:hypothetical protein